MRDETMRLLAATGISMPVLLLVAKATLILAGAGAVTLLMQRATAGSRHMVWLLTLGSLLLVPGLLRSESERACDDSTHLMRACVR